MLFLAKTSPVEDIWGSNMQRLRFQQVENIRSLFWQSNSRQKPLRTQHFALYIQGFLRSRFDKKVEINETSNDVSGLDTANTTPVFLSTLPSEFVGPTAYIPPILSLIIVVGWLNWIHACSIWQQCWFEHVSTEEESMRIPRCFCMTWHGLIRTRLVGWEWRMCSLQKPNRMHRYNSNKENQSRRKTETRKLKKLKKNQDQEATPQRNRT